MPSLAKGQRNIQCPSATPERSEHTDANCLRKRGDASRGMPDASAQSAETDKAAGSARARSVLRLLAAAKETRLRSAPEHLRDPPTEGVPLQIAVPSLPSLRSGSPAAMRNLGTKCISV